MKVDNWFSITVGLARYLVKNASSIRSVFWDSMCVNGIFLQTEVWDTGSRFRCFRAPGAQRDDAIMRLIDWGADESPSVSDRVGNVGVSAPTADRQTQAAPVLESGIAT